MFPTKPNRLLTDNEKGRGQQCPLTATVTNAPRMEHPCRSPHITEWYFYFLCISNTEPKINNGLTNMSLHHELKMGHNCPVFSLHISGAQLHCLSLYISLTNETIGDVLTRTSFHHELLVFSLQFRRQ